MGILQHRKDTEGRIPAYLDRPLQKKGRVGRGEVNRATLFWEGGVELEDAGSGAISRMQHKRKGSICLKPSSTCDVCVFC